MTPEESKLKPVKDELPPAEVYKGGSTSFAIGELLTLKGLVFKVKRIKRKEVTLKVCTVREINKAQEKARQEAMKAREESNRSRPQLTSKKKEDDGEANI